MSSIESASKVTGEMPMDYSDKGFRGPRCSMAHFNKSFVEVAGKSVLGSSLTSMTYGGVEEDAAKKEMLEVGTWKRPQIAYI